MKAIIPAAGYGTRMLPITKTIPKEMLPVGNKPVIQYIVEWLVSAGVTEIAMITSQGKMPLEYYFDKNYELEEQLKRKNKINLLDQINAPKTMANYVFMKQKEQLWLPHAIWEARYWMNDDFFFVTVGDQFGEQAIYREMVELHLQTKQVIIQLAEVPLEEVSKYGVVKIIDDEGEEKIKKKKEEEDRWKNESGSQSHNYSNPVELFNPSSLKALPWDALKLSISQQVTNSIEWNRISYLTVNYNIFTICKLTFCFHLVPS